MSTRENCDKVLLVQADFDGELDAQQSAALVTHRETCPYCREAWAQLSDTRNALRRGATYHSASDALRRRLDRQLAVAGMVPVVTHPRPSATGTGGLLAWWRSLVGFGLGAAVATVAVLMLIQPVPSGDIADLVMENHIRSLQPGHLVDIASNNQHNVKPWFDGKIDFAPPIKNLADQGFPLEGGRLDYLKNREIAALVYRGGQHLINVLVWPADGASEPPQLLERAGYNIIHWQEKDMTLWAISDLNTAELQNFVALWRTHP
ncbi:anti-sigma factor [Dongia soli]|uniref:Anti-sigma factor n=1 Tax=Dongia soli TaxID=600628 RepID=A0ABU5EA10_9PROT|nr:anti-sigma factor [Dongia soli]MDY0883171.1 anti-sigma factor [Dongia soli]